MYYYFKKKKKTVFFIRVFFFFSKEVNRPKRRLCRVLSLILLHRLLVYTCVELQVISTSFSKRIFVFITKTQKLLHAFKR